MNDDLIRFGHPPVFVSFGDSIFVDDGTWSLVHPLVHAGWYLPRKSTRNLNLE